LSGGALGGGRRQDECKGERLQKNWVTMHGR
jgi:hypothetical protein